MSFFLRGTSGGSARHSGNHANKWMAMAIVSVSRYVEDDVFLPASSN